MSTTLSSQLQGRHIIVTGGFGALGRALGAVLAERGARVALLDVAEPPAGLQPNARLLLRGGVDLNDGAASVAAFDAAADVLGGVDALVNVAGGFAWETLSGGSVATWDRMYEMNLRTAVIGAQAVLPHLKARGAGRIVNIGALASQKAGGGMGAYAAAKAGVARLTEALAEELKGDAITVNAVLPSIIDTPANRAAMPDADCTRWVSPQALAGVIAFLLSDEGAPITGACLPVAGRV
ncbi:SDR family NAD(P)-dependent oxidoreductase [Duganella sp. FT92W]|uniref:SDR family NAD(P)-dependent oxidoreductase n=1 Tax=Pseudoduganella rivuli TaxID=2666085 RepID=A0A7X2LPQ1_9BURK|nr:SDR family NAD(P)-dependent oxidoreductase [Pseudoduganella rivuli]MRV70530.1 SDR family NAD(P)-dependent oxidoreductase [Pseudoduganella rivuli]